MEKIQSKEPENEDQSLKVEHSFNMTPSSNTSRNDNKDICNDESLTKSSDDEEPDLKMIALGTFVIGVAIFGFIRDPLLMILVIAVFTVAWFLDLSDK